MPTQDHSDLMSELRATRSVRASMLTFANSIHQRMKVALEANSGNGDMSMLRALCDDLSPTHRDAIADSLMHGTSSAGEGKDADPTAPTPASNPGSLGGNVYGSKGPEDTDTYRDGGPNGNRKELSQPEIDARERQQQGAEARNREEREKNEQNLDQANNAPNSQDDLRPKYGTKSDPNDPHAGDVTSHDRGAGVVQREAGRNDLTSDGEVSQHVGMSTGRGEVGQQDRPAGASAPRNREGDTGSGRRE